MEAIFAMVLDHASRMPLLTALAYTGAITGLCGLVVSIVALVRK